MSMAERLATGEGALTTEFENSKILIDRYQDHLRTKMAFSENTIIAYVGDAEQMDKYLASQNKAQASVDWTKVTNYQLLGVTSKLKEKGYATATIARKVAAMKSFFSWLAEQEIIKTNPAEEINAPKVPAAPPRALRSDEVEKLLAVPEKREGLEALRDAAILRLLYSTGMKSTEALSIDLEDIDLVSDYVQCAGRNGRARQIPFDSLMHDVVKKYIDEALPVLTRRTKSPALFVNHRGERLTRQGFWLIVKVCAKQAGVPSSINPGSLRHSFAMHLLANNANIRDVQELLGHANAASTQRYAPTTSGKK